MSIATNFTRDTLLYDAAGNEVFRTRVFRHVGNEPIEERASYYSADGVLRAVDSRYWGGSLNPFSGNAHYRSAFDEYRYDALGRRVLVRSRRDCHYDPESLEGECRISKIRRTVWDGSQELWEIQMPGGDYSIHLETDVDLPVQPLDYSRATPLDPNPYFGRVGYVHGLGLDQPNAVVRMNYGDRSYADPETARWLKDGAVALICNNNYRPVSGSGAVMRFAFLTKASQFSGISPRATMAATTT